LDTELYKNFTLLYVTLLYINFTLTLLCVTLL